jgi:DNA-binding PadR family transcriptional regulator
MELLTRTEELLLLSVWKLQSDAYGLEVRRHMEKLLGKKRSVGAIYIPLERLVKNGLLNTLESSPTEKRGGRRKRFYNLSGKGMAALNTVRDVQQKAWSGLPELAIV